MTSKGVITADDVPDGWIADVRAIIQRDGYAVRAHPEMPAIQLKSLTTNRWGTLMLPSSAMRFESDSDLRAVLLRLTGKRTCIDNYYENNTI